MASGGGVGIDLDVARVPLREADMEPFEIMVSESQERMLAVVEPARVAEVLALCERWEVGAAAIGEVTDSGRLRVLRDGEVVGDVAVTALVDECPLYDLEPEAPVAPIYPAPARTLDAEDPARCCSPCSPHPTSPPPPAVRAVRLDRPVADRATARRGRRRRAQLPTAARSRCRSTATAAAWPATRTGAPSRRCWSAPPTSPASAPSRSG
jgi:hypothetical protein